MVRAIADSACLAVVQLDPVAGDIAGNLALARSARARAASQGADAIVLSEMFISGHPAEALLLKPAFIAACRRGVEALAGDTGDGGPAVLIGTPWVEAGKLYNSCALLDAGRVETLRHKVALAGDGFLDEKRVFAPGPDPGPVNLRGLRVGVPVGADMSGPDVCECLVETGAELIIALNGSPFRRGHFDRRQQVAVARVVETGLPLIHVNQVGGQDELVFDGASFALNADRSLAFQMAAFAEAMVCTQWTREGDAWRCAEGEVAQLPDDLAAAYAACVLGLRGYVTKNGFPGVLLGLSGGLDSALCAAIAVDALGPERVHCVMLPYRFTSPRSLADARACADALGTRYDVLSIEAAMAGLDAALRPLLEEGAAGIAHENLQSRSRGVLLMALSNMLGAMLLTTGNKSEIAMGYATLYGDMNGGFNPLKDLYKTQCLALAAWRNAHVPQGGLGPGGPVIPAGILTRPPSAELREGQTDQDTLPPYEVLDAILEALVEDDMPVADIVARGHDAETVARVEALLYAAEYKRRQAAPGVTLTRRPFGGARRYPMTNRFRDDG